MFNGLTNLGSLAGLYSGSPLVAAVSSATCKVNGQIVPCNEMFGFLNPLIAILGPIFMFVMLIAIAASILMVVSWWKVFQKAGRPGWAAIIPIYNIVVMLQIVGMSPWLILLTLIPFVGSIALSVVMIVMYVKLAKAFGKDGGFAVGLVLLSIVFVAILAFDQSKFIGITPIAPVTSSGPIPPQNPPTVV